jgi:hypothetical protein
LSILLFLSSSSSSFRNLLFFSSSLASFLHSPRCFFILVHHTSFFLSFLLWCHPRLDDSTLSAGGSSTKC